MGKVEEAFVYPMDFEEFLWANNEIFLAREIRRCFATNTPLAPPLHARADNLYRMHLIVGGMPEVVKAYVDSRPFRPVQARILANYRLDIVKYVQSKPDKQKVARLYDGVISQLGSPRVERRFQYSQLEANGTAKKYREALDWLRQAKLVISCLMVKQGQAPLRLAEEPSGRKLYLSDTGLLCHELKITLANLDVMDRRFLGMLTENYVAQALQTKVHSISESLHYWQNDSSSGQAEVDFIFTTEQGNVPLEVKSGLNTKAKSLAVFLDKYQPALAYKLSRKNFSYDPERRLKMIPAYAIFCLSGIL